MSGASHLLFRSSVADWPSVDEASAETPFPYLLASLAIPLLQFEIGHIDARLLLCEIHPEQSKTGRRNERRWDQPLRRSCSMARKALRTIWLLRPLHISRTYALRQIGTVAGQTGKGVAHGTTFRKGCITTFFFSFLRSSLFAQFAHIRRNQKSERRLTLCLRWQQTFLCFH